jgi:acyl-CoA reductase-like NAD-dependent aldehyde dehydrogenase
VEIDRHLTVGREFPEGLALLEYLDVYEMREAVSFAGHTMVRREPVGVTAVIASW